MPDVVVQRRECRRLFYGQIDDLIFLAKAVDAIECDVETVNASKVERFAERFAIARVGDRERHMRPRTSRDHR